MESVNYVNRTNQRVPFNLRALACSVLVTQLALVPYTYAEPTGGNIVGGAGNINHSGLTTSITQESQNLAINWNSFNLEQNESVNFYQPDQSSIALNRILDSNASQIHGSINANGQIILVNPNGVFFSETATVNAGGLFAAALSINPQDFMAGHLNFKALENTTGLIINNGKLTVIDGGTLALFGQKVVNNGLLVANFGTVVLAAGGDINVYFEHGEQLGIQIDQDRLADILELDDPSVLNSGLIQAHGGRVVLTARQAQAIQSSVYHIDEDQAFSFTDGSVVEKDGVIYLAGPGGDISNIGEVDVSSDGDAGTVIFDARNINHSGAINADSQNGNGGTVQFNATDTTLLTGNSITSAQSLQNGHGGDVQVLGNHVGLTDSANIDASGANGGGDVLIGGDYQGKNPNIKNAEAVYLGEDTNVSVNATENGNGGKIIVWSDKATRAYGALNAVGGGQSGNGGFIETSSHNYVDLRAEVDVHAETGEHGEWLIDPSNLTIGNADIGTQQTGDIFQSTINDSFLDVDTLELALSTGSNIVVQTVVIPGICAPQPCVPAADDQLEPTGGNINLNLPLDLEDMPGNGMRSLTLNADHDININADISESGAGTRGDDYLNLTLNADRNNAGGGSVIIDASASIDLDGGNLIVTGAGFDNNGSITTVNSTNPGDTPGGDVTINVVNVANIGDISTDDASGNLNVIAGSINGGPLNIAGTTTLFSAGAINLSNLNNNFIGAVNIDNGTVVTLADSNDLTVNINNNSVTSIATNTGGNSNIVDIDSTGTELAAMTVGGDLDVTANGSITDSGDINVAVNTILSVPDGSSITLDSTNNNFTGTLNVMANTLADLTIYDTSAFVLQNNINMTGALDLRGTSVTTNNVTLGNASALTLTSTSGNISQNNAITHAGSTILSANGNILFTQSNNLSTVQVIQANTATISNGANALVLNGVSSTNNLNVTATGGITDAGILNVTNTATFDAGTSGVTLNNNTHALNNVQITAAGAVQINENDNINIAGNMASLNVTAGLGGGTSTIGNIVNSTLAVSGDANFTFANGGDIDLSNGAQSDLMGVVSVVTTAGNISDVTINNISNLQLSALTDTSGGIDTLNLSSDNGISQTGTFNVDGTTTLQANNITLQQNNDFNIVTINDSGVVNIHDNNGGINVVANNTNASNTIDLTLTATGDVGVEGELLNMNVTTSGDIQSANALNTLTVANNTIVDAGTVGNIDFQTNTVDLNNVTIVNANAVLIDETDGINLSGTMQSLNVNVINGDIGNDTTGLSVATLTSLTASTGNITLDNATNDFNTLEIGNALDVTVRDTNNLELLNVTARDFNLTTAGDVIQSAGTHVTSTGNSVINAGAANVTLSENNLFANLGILANQATIVNDQALVLTDSTLGDSLTVTTNNGDLSLHSITATNTINLTAADALLDANGDANNLVAQKATLRAANGIGNGADINSDINTQLVHLEAHNTTSGDINIKNTGGDITLDNITNGAIDTGNFNFESTDNVFINTITLQQNLTENFFNTGTGTVNMRTVDGSFFGVGATDINSPDITATNLRLVGVKGTLGTIQRPMVLDISGKVEILMRASLSPIYAPPAPLPEDIQDNSILQFTSGDTLSAVNGVQVTEVETLLDINPAIFTDIRHFVVDSDPVKLPRDQQFEGGYTDDDDEAYFRRMAGEKK